MKTSEDYQRLLKTKGVSLQELGIRDIALDRDDALLAVQFLQKAAIPILGGDVYLRRGNGIELAYADWHSDPKPGEELESYLSRSSSTAQDYVKNFRQPMDATILFAIVI